MRYHKRSLLVSPRLANSAQRVMASAASASLTTYLLAVTELAIPRVLAQGGNQTCAYIGGWSLRADQETCPPATPVGCGFGAQPRCCPSGLVCAGEGIYPGNYCCPQGEDCEPQILESPKCPDPSWILWAVDGQLSSYGGWCCTAGTNGTYWSEEGKISVGCVTSNAKPMSSNQSWAKTVSTSSCTVTPTSSSANSTSTSTITGAVPATTSAVDTDSGGGLQPSAIAGIAVGSAAAVVLLLITGATLFWRRRRQREVGNVGTGKCDDIVQGYAHEHAAELGNEEAVEMNGVQTAELGNGEIWEMGGGESVGELDGRV